jgi:hypothetical protein
VSFIADLRTFVLAGTGIATKVGPRMHYQEIPKESTLPAIVFFRVGTLPENRLTGKAGLQRRRMQLGVRSNSALEAAEVADLVQDRVEAHRGQVGAGSVESIVFLDRFDGWDPQMESYADDIDVAVWVKPNGEE